MKRLVFFCAVYFGGMSIAFSDDLGGEFDLIRRHGRQVSLLDLQRRHIDDAADLQTRDLIFRRTSPRRSISTRPLASSSRSSPSGSPPGSPPESPRGSMQGAKERSKMSEEFDQLKIQQGESSGRRERGGIGIARAGGREARRPASPAAGTPNSMDLARSWSFGSPPIASSSGPYSFDNLAGQQPQSHTKAHIKMRGPGSMAINSNTDAMHMQNVASGRLALAGGQNVGQIHANAAPREGASSTIYATGRRVEGHVENVPGQGTSVLQTTGQGGGEMKIALPGQMTKIGAAATGPGETVGVKIKSHGPAIAGASAYNFPPET